MASAAIARRDATHQTSAATENGWDVGELAAIFTGGAVGTLARAGLSVLTPHDPSRWPWSTFVVNIVGAFLVGYVTARLLERLPLSSFGRPALGTGFCGGLTTFSTMQLETLTMFEHHHDRLAVGYALSSAAAGLAAVYVGTAMVRWARCHR